MKQPTFCEFLTEWLFLNAKQCKLWVLLQFYLVQYRYFYTLVKLSNPNLSALPPWFLLFCFVLSCIYLPSYFGDILPSAAEKYFQPRTFKSLKVSFPMKMKTESWMRLQETVVFRRALWQKWRSNCWNINSWHDTGWAETWKALCCGRQKKESSFI